MLLAAGTACLAAERLDDSASPRTRVQAPVVLGDDGRPLKDSRNPTRAIVQFGRVDYKLSTARYVGRQARIYYVVPAFIPGLRSPSGLRVTWRGNGLFAAGDAGPGERRLVWNGVVPGAWMAEALDLTFQVDLRELQLRANQPFGFESYFEIEVSP
jgi:hypothetical protein